MSQEKAPTWACNFNVVTVLTTAAVLGLVLAESAAGHLSNGLIALLRTAPLTFVLRSTDVSYFVAALPEHDPAKVSRLPSIAILPRLEWIYRQNRAGNPQ